MPVKEIYYCTYLWKGW